ATGGGAISLVNGQHLTVAGPVFTTGDVTLFVLGGSEGGPDPDLIISSSIISGATVTLFAFGNISETASPLGTITATNLVAVTELNGGGAITLDQANT